MRAALEAAIFFSLPVAAGVGIHRFGAPWLVPDAPGATSLFVVAAALASWRSRTGAAVLALAFGVGVAFHRVGAPCVARHVPGVEPLLAIAAVLAAWRSGFFDEPLAEPAAERYASAREKSGEDNGSTAAEAPSCAPEEARREQRLVVVFTSTGRAGSHLVRAALDAGFRVRVFSRDPSRLLTEAPAPPVGAGAVESVPGELDDDAAVRAAMAGASIAICVAGTTRRSRKSFADGLMRGFAASALDGMREHGVRRLVYQAGALCVAPGERPSMGKRLLRLTLAASTGMLAAIEDHDAAIARLADHAHNVSWAVTMPGMLSEQPSKGQLEGRRTPTEFPQVIAHADLARWTLAVAADDDCRGCLHPAYPSATAELQGVRQ
ncbi:hypothetical protein KFE25_004841 [Diacronema lutheri]|uniref:NAD(P)-binding domain-containing protein n=1 Tax=Diacronema lutheri TaxID=2081491 RepID=A0A8J5XPZ7_DIALT|nr:hypothetical protein KFE25_004841 [Diacronema lutheri]